MRRSRLQEIVDAAARVFHDKSYEAATIQDVADEVGLLKGSLYHYISSKEDLLAAIATQIIDEYMALLDETLARVDGEPPLVRVRAVVELHALYYARDLVKSSVFHRDIRSLDADRYQPLRTRMDGYADLLRGLVRDAQADGSVCPEVVPAIAVNAILGTLNVMYLWLRPAGGLPADEAARQLVDIAMAGIASDPSSHSAGHRRTLAAAAPRSSDRRRRPR